MSSTRQLAAIMFTDIVGYTAMTQANEQKAVALKEFTDKYQNNWSYLQAQLHDFRGEKDLAFTWLETAYNKKDSWLYWLKGDPLLKNLKDDNRLKTFMKKMNLTF